MNSKKFKQTHHYASDKETRKTYGCHIANLSKPKGRKQIKKQVHPKNYYRFFRRTEKKILKNVVTSCSFLRLPFDSTGNLCNIKNSLPGTTAERLPKCKCYVKIHLYTPSPLLDV